MAIAVGDIAPDFTLKDQNQQVVRLSDFRGKKNVLVVFFPFVFSGVCHGELCEVRDHVEDFVNNDSELLTISVDAPYAQKAWATAEGYTFTQLADFWPHGAVASSYGVFNADHGFALRGTFLVDRAGVVQFAEVNGPGEPRDQNNWRKALAAL
jgi:mycoredoxin-dependent peroxiredoxin